MESETGTLGFGAMLTDLSSASSKVAEQPAMLESSVAVDAQFSD
jgi:hypothetical protein